MESRTTATRPKLLELLVTQIFLITVAMSNYGRKERDLPAAKEDAQTMHDNFRKMGVPQDQIQHLVDPDKADFFAAIKNVKQSLQSEVGRKIQLFLHYSGHGMGNGGYIAQLGGSETVNLSEVCSALSRDFSGIWILLIFDACTVAQQLDGRADWNFDGAAPVATFKTVTLSACRLGQQAFNHWKFTKSFADFMAQKVVANNGHFQIPGDLFGFQGPNGERELAFGLTEENFISLKFPNASSEPKSSPEKQPARKSYVFTYTDVVGKKSGQQDQEYPVFEQLNWFNPLSGVSTNKQDAAKYQFISVDGTRSEFDRSKCKEREWIDYIIPQGKQISKIETLLDRINGQLLGFKWVGSDGAVLVVAGLIQDPSQRNDPDYVLKSFTLNQNQRLLGIKSYSTGVKHAWHESFQWVICTQE